MAYVCRLTIILVCNSQVSLTSMAATSREPFFFMQPCCPFLVEQLHDLDDIYVVGRSWRLWYTVQRRVSHWGCFQIIHLPHVHFSFKENPHDNTRFFCFLPRPSVAYVSTCLHRRWHRILWVPGSTGETIYLTLPPWDIIWWDPGRVSFRKIS